MERLQKKIAESGLTSRRKAEELIQAKRVKVNGKIVSKLGTKVSNEDMIEVDGKQLELTSKKVYYLLNKPRGVISSTNDNLGRKTVIDCINSDERIYPIGRLDYDTTGLIILTNDGEFANFMMHPNNKIEKTYLVKIEGILTKEEIDKLKNNMIIEGRKVEIRHFKIKRKDLVKNNSFIEITIIEGRNHIIKKIFQKLNHDVIKLSRIKIAFLNTDGLKSGEYRPLKIKEIKKLYSLK